MKTKQTQLFASLSKESTNKLTTLVKETLAYELADKKTFTAADLWNIQRRRKTVLQRRHLPVRPMSKV